MSSQEPAEPRGRAGLGTWLIAGYFVTAAPMAAGGGLALAPVQALAGLIGGPWRRIWSQCAEVWTWFGLMLGFAGWVALSALWSAQPVNPQSFRLLGGVICGILFVAGAGIDGPSRRMVRAAGVAFALALTVYLLVEAFAGMPINRLDQPDTPATTLMRNPSRGASVLVLSIWGVIAALAGGKSHERWLWRALFLSTAVLSLQFDMNANAIAMGLGLCAYLLALAAPGFAAVAVTSGLAAWLLAAPWVAPRILALPQVSAHLPDSWYVRGEIWKFVCAKIARNPWLGEGLDASRRYSTPISGRGLEWRQIPLHPHSGSLQIWFETGAVGALLGAAVLIWGGIALARKLSADRQAMAGACGAIAAAGVVANVSYGAWQEWWVATLFGAAALVSAARR